MVLNYRLTNLRQHAGAFCPRAYPAAQNCHQALTYVFTNSSTIICRGTSAKASYDARDDAQPSTSGRDTQVGPRIRRNIAQTPRFDLTDSTAAAISAILFQQPADWDYKYIRRPCTSACDPGDSRCLKIEALVQNVLDCPRLPPRVARWLCNVTAPLEQITEMVEHMEGRLGRELALYTIRRAPFLLNESQDSMSAKLDHVRSMLGVSGSELLMLVRKNPSLLGMDSVELRARYQALHRTVGMSHEQVSSWQALQSKLRTHLDSNACNITG